MANYCSWMVTEKPFGVKDPEAFKKELEAVGVHKGDSCGYAGLSYEQEKDGTFWLGGYDASLHYYDEENEEDISIVPLVQKHMKGGEIAVFMVVGQEKLRDVSGSVVVVTPEKELCNDLHSMSKKMMEKAMWCEDCGRELAQNDPQVRLEDDSVYCLQCAAGFIQATKKLTGG